MSTDAQGGTDTGFRCVQHRTPIRWRADGHAECALWRECGSTSDREAFSNHAATVARALPALQRAMGVRR